MSRTFRRDIVELDENCVPLISRRDKKEHEYRIERIVEENGDIYSWWYHPYIDAIRYDYYSRHNSRRDDKPWQKPPKWFKTMMKRLRRAKEKSAIRKAQNDFDLFDLIPKFRKSDKWEWL